MSAKFEIFIGENKEFYFHLKAANGEVILNSEGYTTKDNCLKGANSVKENCKNSHSFEKKIAKNGRFFFNLKAKNGQVIGTSQMYSSEQSREKGIASVQTNGSLATVVDLTSEKNN